MNTNNPLTGDPNSHIWGAAITVMAANANRYRTCFNEGHAMTSFSDFQEVMHTVLGDLSTKHCPCGAEYCVSNMIHKGEWQKLATMLFIGLNLQSIVLEAKMSKGYNAASATTMLMLDAMEHVRRYEDSFPTEHYAE
jgi:hypothetical protein